MTKLTTSLVLACANVVLVTVGYLNNWKHVLVPDRLPGELALLPGAVSLVVIPFLVLTTLGFAIRDLIRIDNRWQAVVALLLSVPIGVIYATTGF